ncbi:MAG: hypothetical protein ABGZ17_25810 [Planctomycetaceae bacterium]
MRWIFAIVCLPVGGFCIFGFLATFEPTSNAIAFRIGYTVVGLACLAGIAFPLIPRKGS